MSTSTTIGQTSPSAYAAPAFWERLWRMSGISFVAFFIIAYVIYGQQPQVGARADALVAFYEGNRTPILIAAGLSAWNVLNLLWFAAALRTTLANANRDGWGAAVTASSAMLGGLLLLLISLVAALACSIAGAGHVTLTAGLNDLVWAGVVMTSFPRAMLIMAGTFGLWRAGLISNALFGVGIIAVVLVLLGGTTWLSDGFWAPDGAYSRLISPIVGLAWTLVVTHVLLSRSPVSRTGW